MIAVRLPNSRETGFSASGFSLPGHIPKTRLSRTWLLVYWLGASFWCGNAWTWEFFHHNKTHTQLCVESCRLPGVKSNLPTIRREGGGRDRNIVETGWQLR